MNIKFWKYQGTGNDFIMLDGRKQNFKDLSSEKIKYLCHRRFGIGADGLIILENSPDTDFIMRYYNSDGHKSSMCGNGGRCITKFALDQGLIRDKYEFLAVDGLHESYINEGKVFLKMSDVQEVTDLGHKNYFVETGSPHYVRLVSELPEGSIVETAREIRNSASYQEAGVNVNFVALDEHGLAMRTYERGVEDETLSCGTGVTASALVAHQAGFKNDGSIMIHTRGGNLELRFKVDGKGFNDIWLIGKAEMVYSGEIEI